MNRPIRTDQIRTPVVVIGADGDDVVVPADEVADTARVYGTTAIRIPGAHDMMLDVHWKVAARAIERAIAEHLPSTRVSAAQPG